MTRRYPFFIQSLWSWGKGNEEASRALIYGLKGCSHAKRWLLFATLILEGSGPLPRGACLIPIPSKRGRADHATGLARALHFLTGYPLENVLIARPKEHHQRELTRRQRSLIELEKAKRWRKSYDHFIVVDDVVTSGATLAAAFKALNEPISIQALCLMDRAR